MCAFHIFCCVEGMHISHRSELIWQLRASNSSNFKTVPEDIRQRLELAYQSDPKAIVKDDSTNLHVGVDVYSVCIVLCVYYKYPLQYHLHHYRIPPLPHTTTTTYHHYLQLNPFPNKYVYTPAMCHIHLMFLFKLLSVKLVFFVAMVILCTKKYSHAGHIYTHIQ